MLSASPAARRVAFVEASAQMGGVEFSTLYLTERLRRDCFEPLVICPADGDLPRECRARAIPVVILRQPPLFSTSFRLGRRAVPNPLAWLTNAGLFLVIAARLAKSLRQEGVALVCTKGLFSHIYGGLAARWAGRPCVWHAQDLLSSRAGEFYPLVFGLAARILARRVIADGAPIAAQLAPYYSADRTTVIQNGVDLDLISPAVEGGAVRTEWRVAQGDLLIGNVARLTRWKGQHHLVEAFAALAADFPSAKLVLVGAPIFDSPAYEHELRGLAARLGVAERVIFAGFRWDLPTVLAAFDVFAYPAVEKDTSPLSVVSAMAAGKPIVAAAVPGVVELFPTGVEAVLCPPADSAALAAALRLVLADPARRAALGQAARRQAERALSLDSFARQCEAVFELALVKYPAQTPGTRRAKYRG